MSLDRQELAGDASILMLTLMQTIKAEVWTALPGIVQSFDPAQRTCSIQPAVQSVVTDRDGTRVWMDMPLLVDCPVVFPSGGGVVLTFPVTIGDEVLVIFASRCIDNWWQSGGVQQQAELRFHDLSDGFCLPGVESKPNVTGSISTTAAELRSKDGQATISLNPSTHAVEVDTVGPMSITAPTIALNGNVAVTGTLTNNGKSVGSTHTHSGVTPGGGTTGAPT